MFAMTSKRFLNHKATFPMIQLTHIYYIYTWNHVPHIIPMYIHWVVVFSICLWICMYVTHTYDYICTRLHTYINLHVHWFKTKNVLSWQTCIWPSTRFSSRRLEMSCIAINMLEFFCIPAGINSQWISLRIHWMSSQRFFYKGKDKWPLRRQSGFECHLCARWLLASWFRGIDMPFLIWSFVLTWTAKDEPAVEPGKTWQLISASKCQN